MENVIFVGTKIEKDAADNLAIFVDKVFASGKVHGMEQNTIVHALSLIQKIAEVSHNTIERCNFTGEKHIHIDTADPIDTGPEE